MYRMAQNISDQHNGPKSKIRQDISSRAFNRRRQNNSRSSRGHARSPHQLQPSFSAHVRMGSGDLNQSSSVHEPASHCKLTDVSCSITSADTCVPAAGALSYHDVISLCGSALRNEAPGQEMDPDQQNSLVAVREAIHDVQLVHGDGCLLTDRNCCDYEKEDDHVMSNQLFNKDVRANNSVGKISSTHGANTQHNISCCPRSIFSNQASESKSFRPKNENQCDLKSEQVKLRPKKLELASLIPVSSVVNIAAMEAREAQKRNPQPSTSHICSAVTGDKPSESTTLRTNEDAWWKIKQKTTSVQRFKNQHKSICDAEHKNSYTRFQSQLQMGNEEVPSSATRLSQKQSGAEPHLKETQRKSSKIREIQQMLQLDKCQENALIMQRNQYGNKNLNKQNNLMKQEKPYRQWHRISRVVTAESRFIISHQIYSDVSSGPKKNATLSEHRIKCTVHEASTETESRLVKYMDEGIKDTNRGTDSCNSKAQYKNLQSKSSNSNHNYATKIVKSSIENIHDINQLEDAEITRNVSSSDIPARATSNVCLHIFDTTVYNTDVHTTLSDGASLGTTPLTRTSARVEPTALSDDGKSPDSDYADSDNLNSTTSGGKHLSEFLCKSEGPGFKLSGCKDLVIPTDRKELSVRPHAGANLINGSVDGTNLDYYPLAGNDLRSIPHKLDALAVNNKELINISVENKHRRVMIADLNQDSINARADIVTVSNSTCTLPKLCNSIDANLMSTGQSKAPTHQLSATHLPHRIFFTSRARSKSLKSFYLAKRQNKRKHLKQTMGEKWRMRDHSADSVYVRADIIGCIKPRNSVSRVSEVTGPSIASNRKCKVSDDYLEMAPLLVNVPEITTEQRISNVGNIACRISGLVNSASVCNNSTAVTINQRPGRARSRNENHQTSTIKYRGSSKTGRHSEEERRRQNICQQKRSVCKTTCSIKRHASAERHYSSGQHAHKDNHPPLPASGPSQLVLSDIASKLSLQVKRRRVRVHWSEPGQKCVGVQAMADWKGTSPGQLSFGKGQVTEQHSDITDSTNDTKNEVCHEPGRTKRRKRRGTISSSTSSAKCPKDAKKKLSRATSEN